MSDEVRSARIVIECVPSSVTGHEFRIWTEHDGRAFNELRTDSFGKAIGLLMGRVQEPLALGVVAPHEDWEPA